MPPESTRESSWGLNPAGFPRKGGGRLDLSRVIEIGCGCRASAASTTSLKAVLSAELTARSVEDVCENTMTIAMRKRGNTSRCRQRNPLKVAIGGAGSSDRQIPSGGLIFAHHSACSRRQAGPRAAGGHRRLSRLGSALSPQSCRVCRAAKRSRISRRASGSRPA